MATKTKRTTRKGPGRPKGSTRTVPDFVNVEPSRCKRCGSTRRSDYYGKTEQAFQGEYNGRPYTHIVRRRTKCLGCGQIRIDRTYENRPYTGGALTA
jgi:hypothetical protein